MPTDNPEYDVAISFLSRDQGIAAAIHQKLSEGLRVFFYPRSQEELAGTDGMETMRTPFFDNSRVMVVLFREPWGKTPWTRIEETAIKEGCLEHGWERLFFISLEPESTLPVWLPKNLVRLNYADFGLEQAVGAIKARVQEQGGQPQPLTPKKRAEMFKADELFRRDKSRMNSEEGLVKVVKNVAELFCRIEKHTADVNAEGSLEIRCAKDFRERNSYQTCAITDGHVGLTVVWHQTFTNTLSDSALIVREYNGGLILPGETHRVHLVEPSQLREIRYSPELSFAREYGWKEENQTEFLSSDALAQRCVIQFVDLVNRDARGAVKRRSPF